MLELSKEFIDLCHSVTAKRPKTVIDHILKNGFITTEDLKKNYGYNHPPRAVRDVREHGIPLETYRVTGSDGRKIAAYRFGNISTNRVTKPGLSLNLMVKWVDRLGYGAVVIGGVNTHSRGSF